MERLQRVIASRGISSRRSAEELITSGRVLVNGLPVTELGTRVNTTSDEIRVDGKILRPQRLRTILLNKPVGYITTMQDERERRTVMELVDTKERLFPVGRLDRDTEGLLLLTNDGELANRIMHPRYKLAKEYHVLTNVRPTDRTLQYLRDGIRIDTRDVVPDEIRLLRETREGIWIRIVIHEGFYHAVRRIMEAANINVLRLRRHRIGPISLTGLDAGHYRDLTAGEISQISEAVHLDRDAEQVAPTSVERVAPSAPRAASGRPTPRQGRARLTSDRRSAGADQSTLPPGDGRSRPDRTPNRPAAQPRKSQAAAVAPPRSPIVERPGAWSARRPENPVVPRGARPSVGPSSTSGPAASSTQPGRPQPAAPIAPPSTPRPAEGPPQTVTPVASGRFETVGGRTFSEVNRTFRSERPPSERRSAPRPGSRRPRPENVETSNQPRSATGSPDPRGDDAHRPERPAFHSASAGTQRGDGGPVRTGRDRMDSEPRRPFPDRSGRTAQRRPANRPDRAASSSPSDAPARGASSERSDARPARRQPARRPSAPGRAGMADPDSRRPFADRGSRPPTHRPTTERSEEPRRSRQTDGGADDGARRSFPDRSGRPAQRRTSRRLDGAGQSSRPLETIGRVSRKVASDNPDEAPSRLKRRSPHPHSHRGRKPKPAAPKINTTKARSTKTTQGKGNRRGRRR